MGCDWLNLEIGPHKGPGKLENKKLGPGGDVGSKYHDILLMLTETTLYEQFFVVFFIFLCDNGLCSLIIHNIPKYNLLRKSHADIQSHNNISFIFSGKSVNLRL